MRRLRVPTLGIAVILSATSLLGAAGPTALASSRQRDTYRNQMFSATNNSRLTHSRGRLSLNDQMSALAEHHSAEMARRGYLFHTSNVDTYLEGISWHRWGENVGYTQGGTVSDLEKAFMASPVHRDNILESAYRHVAIGTVYSGGALWVTVFFYG